VPIDRKHIGFSLPPFTVLVEHEQLRRFSEAIGNSVHSGVAPPTYMKVIEGENGGARAIVAALGVDLRRVMHVEQEFEYGAPIRGGDHVTVERRVVDIFDRKDGAHEFVILESTLLNADGVRLGRSTQRILVRNEVQIAHV
jgi:hypothetical protein